LSLKLFFKKIRYPLAEAFSGRRIAVPVARESFEQKTFPQ
jgi:hypothetical protein